MATLAELRKKVQLRLRDWNKSKWDPMELDALLNEAQDDFTRRSKYLRGVNKQNIVDGTSLYSLTPASGYRIGQILEVVYYDGSVFHSPLTIISPQELAERDSDWRNSTGDYPTYAVLNFNDGTADTAANDSVRLYPEPSSSVTNGLQVTYVMHTDGQMTADATAMALPERIALEALVNYAVSEAMIRRAAEHPEETQFLSSQAADYRSRYEADLRKASMEALLGYGAKPPKARIQFF